MAALAFTLVPFVVACGLALLGGGADGPWRIWLPAGLVAISAIAAGMKRSASWPSVGLTLTSFVLIQTIALPPSWTARQAEQLEPALDAAGVTLRSAISYDASASAIGALVLASAFAAFALTRAGASRSLQASVAAITLLTVVCAGEALAGAGQFTAGLVSEGGEAVARGTFTSRAHYSAFLLGGMGAAIGLGSAALRSRLRQPLPAAAILWTLSAVCAAGVAMSLSRAGILIASAQVVAAIWWMVPRRWRILALAVAATAGLAGAALSPQTQRLVTERFDQLVESTGDPGRLAIWKDTIPLIARHPLLGVGLEAYPFAFNRSEPYFARKTVQHAHSDPLEFTAELGLPPAVLLLGSVLMVGVRTARASHRLAATESALVHGCLLGASGIALQSLVDSPLHLPATAVGFAALLGAASGLAAPLREPSPTLRTAHMVVAAAVLANALIWTSHSTPDVFDRAEALFAQGQTDQAAETYRELLSVNPFAAPAWLRLAGIARTKGRVEDALSLTYAAHQVEPHTLRTIWPLVEAELQAGQVDSAVARLASLVAHKPDLRPAAYLTAHRGGAPIALIETRLADEEPYAAGEYLAFLTRIGAWDRWSVAHKRFEKNLGDAHRRFLDQAVAERQSALDHSAGR